MSKQVMISETQLLERICALPRARPLPAALWSRVEVRLDRPAGRGYWFQEAIAALLVAALGLAVVRIGGDGQPIGRATTPSLAWQIDTAATEREYSAALQDMRGLGLFEETELPAATRAEVEANLRVVRNATRQVRAAMQENPDAAYLSGMLAKLHRRQLDVLRGLALSTPTEAPEDDQRRAS